MKSPSKGGRQPTVGGRQWKLRPIVAGVAVLWVTGLVGGAAWASGGTFSVVPAGDSTYSELKQLARAGWLSPRDVAPSILTRFDVAELVLKAENNSTGAGVRRAQVPQGTPTPSDMLLPPPTDLGPSAGEVPNGPATLSPAQKAATLVRAEKSLHSLEGAYAYELKKVRDSLKDAESRANKLDSVQFDLQKHLDGITQFPTIAVHGLGRAFGFSRQYSGNDPAYLFSSGVRSTPAYLDLQPQGTVSKEVRWNFILRLGSTLTPNDSPDFVLRRVTMEFNPPWLSATVGDFDEAYTPFTLWNRDNLDLYYKPEMWARQDDTAKYEAFLNHEPNRPFRGLKLCEALMWPGSNLLEKLTASAFVDMVRNGFNDNDGWYFGPNQFTDWAVGGKAGLESPKWYWEGASWKARVDTYGVILDEPFNSQQPGSSYNPNDPGTWARQYLTGSVKPDLKVGLGGGVYLGGTAEYAFSSYQDDKLDSQRVVSDYAFMGGPYLRFGDSKVSFTYLNVDPYFYSPLAQTRQDAVTAVPERNPETSPDLFEAPLRSQYFLDGIPRAGGIFSFYDRTLDNTFPYGLATPNRNGVGMDLDIQALRERALKVRGSAYLVSEIDSNLVLGPGQAYEAVDAPSGVFPTRSFTYVNLGPSFNLGPYLGLDRALEVGTNVRYEQTTSSLGTLTSTWVIGGIRAEVLPVWEISAAFSQRNAQGTEWGYGGTLWARMPYLFDASDLGRYSAFHVDGSVQSLRLSSAFKVNRNSTLYLDYDWTTGNMLPNNPDQGTVNNQYTEVTYEVQF